jgi:hypothetical protein
MLPLLPPPAASACNPEQIDAIKISDQELDAFRFCTEAEASDLLRPYVWSRAALALEAMRTGRTHYAHYGAAVSDGIDTKPNDQI